MDFVPVRIVSSNPKSLERVCQQLSDYYTQNGVLDASVTTFENIQDALVLDTEKLDHLCLFFFVVEDDNEGMDLVRKFRLCSDFSFAPIVILSAQPKTRDTNDSYKLGIQNSYFLEDFTDSDLKSVIGVAKKRIEAWRGYVLHQQKKNEQIAVVSHDLKSPLSVIKSYMDIILEDHSYDLPTEVIDKLTRTRQNAVLALDLIYDILDEFRAKRSWRLNFSRINLKNLIEESGRNLKLKIDQKNLSIETDVSGIQEIYGDRKSLNQLFSNVVGNAVKFSPENGRIRISCVKVSAENFVSSREIHGDWIKVSISDEGPGVPKHQRTQIFSSLKQARESDRKIGFGLGLSISKKICKLHMGKIFVEETGQSGATFSIILPAFKNDVEQAVQVQSIFPQSEAKTSTPKTILVIEDKEDVQDITRSRLKKLGFNVLSAKTGAQGLVLLKESKVDLILLDINMPIMGGDTFLRIYQTMRPTMHVPVFIYTNYTTDPVFMKCLKLADGYVQKTLSIDEFKQKTSLLLNWNWGVDQSLKKQSQSNSGSSRFEKKTHKSKVLLVDDSADNRDIMMYHFKNSRHSLSLAKSGSECLTRLEDTNYDLVLMDLHMPDMDGYDVVERVRGLSAKQKAKTPIYAFSVADLELSEERVKMKGFDGVLYKPVNMNVLNGILDQLALSKTVN